MAFFGFFCSRGIGLLLSFQHRNIQCDRICSCEYLARNFWMLLKVSFESFSRHLRKNFWLRWLGLRRNFGSSHLLSY